MARQPTTMAMYVEARGAHWLLGSVSLLTRCMFSNRTAEMPSDAPEKARTIIRKINGINGFFNINRYSSVSNVTVLELNSIHRTGENPSRGKSPRARLDRKYKRQHTRASTTILNS